MLNPRLSIATVLVGLSALPAGTLGAFAQESLGDPAAGERVFRECAACHAIEEGENRAGPHLVGIVGRAVASVPGFRYSDALIQSGIVWDADSLAAYSMDPTGFLPGTTMRVPLRQRDGIDDLIAYLATLQPATTP